MKFIISALLTILLDIICGITLAAKNKQISSSIMRTGFYHKCGEVLALVMSFLSDQLIKIFGYSVDFKIVYAVSAYIVIMELISILENITSLNDKLQDGLLKIFKFLKGGKEQK